MNMSHVDESLRHHAHPASDGNESVFEIVSVLRRQRWIVVLFVLIGLGLGLLYAFKAQPWYQSSAKVLINLKSAGLSGTTTAEKVEEDVLASHIEILRSRRIVQAALEKDGLMELDSIKPFLTESVDAADYVIEQLELTRGGGGDAKEARSLVIAFTHPDPVDSQRILESVLVEYQKFIVDQVEAVMSSANRLVSEAKQDVEAELRAAEQEYMEARRDAPLLFQGEGSSNVYQDKYRRLEEELINLQIEEASVRTRLDGVTTALESMADETEQDQLDKLALIDSKSLERLGLFAGLKMNASTTAEFQAAQPERIAEAQAEYEQLLELMSEKQRLSSVFGEQHPRVQDIEDEITLVKNFLTEKQEKLQGTVGLGDLPLNPPTLLRAYVGFLKNDLAAFAQRKKELEILSAEAENQAKQLIDFEIEDQILRNKITRQEALFDGVVQQLRDLDTASGLSGYIYELLETPRLGIQVWPSIPISGLGGLMLGLLAGLSLAVANDVRDGRFRSAAELDNAVGLPMLGRIGKLQSARRGVRGLIATELSPDAESFRMGRTLLLSDIRSGKLSTLAMTSPMQGDGKSTVLSNFAVSVAQVGLKVLILDADLRRPSQHRFFSVPVAEGLSDIINGDLDVEAAIKPTEIKNVSIITAGSPTTTPAELLQSGEFDHLLDDLSNQFDLVLIDLPPVLAVSDPLVVAPKVGGLVVVIRMGTARRDEVANSIRRLRSAGASLVGCMLNGYGSGKKFDGAGGYFGYYESSYTRSKAVSKRATQSRLAKPAAVSRDGSLNDEPVAPGSPK